MARAALAASATTAAHRITGSAARTPMIIQVSSTAVPMHPAVPARLADRYRLLRADTASRVITATSTRPGTMAAAIGTGQVHARPLTSATAQHEPTTGPVPSSLRAVLRAGCVRANSAAISPGSPNSATAARAAVGGSRPCPR